MSIWKQIKKIRQKTWWCIDEKHAKCVGEVSKIKAEKQRSSQLLAKDNFNYSKCKCFCH